MSGTIPQWKKRVFAQVRAREGVVFPPVAVEAETDMENSIL